MGFDGGDLAEWNTMLLEHAAGFVRAFEGEGPVVLLRTPVERPRVGVAVDLELVFELPEERRELREKLHRRRLEIARRKREQKVVAAVDQLDQHAITRLMDRDVIRDAVSVALLIRALQQLLDVRVQGIEARVRRSSTGRP